MHTFFRAHSAGKKGGIVTTRVAGRRVNKNLDLSFRLPPQPPAMSVNDGKHRVTYQDIHVAIGRTGKKIMAEFKPDMMVYARSSLLWLRANLELCAGPLLAEDSSLHVSWFVFEPSAASA